MSKREILGYFIAINGAGIMGPMYLLTGIEQLQFLRPFYGIIALIGLCVMLSGLGLAAATEKGCCGCGK